MPVTRGDCLNELPMLSVGVKTWVWDPPYNIGWDYGEDFADKMEWRDYAHWVEQVAFEMKSASNNRANLFFIHYPIQTARLLPYLEAAGWNVKQWLTWVYPSNFGHSKSKFTTASRAVLWLTIGEPAFAHRVKQPYRNPNDKRIQELMAKGSTGTAHYDWLNINLVKNTSDEKRYVNQIPEALLEILILNTTVEGEWVGDPTCGSGSTVRVAQRFNRNGWGCDLSRDAEKCWGDLE
jgi:DNA modification methylase